MRFVEESGIFKNEQVLSPEFLPDTLPHRENQIQQLANNLLPASKGRKPQNTFIFGSPGIGKTVTSRHVFRQFEEFSGIKTVYLNCWDFNTSVSVLSKLVSEFGFFVQRRGWGKDEIMERLIEALKKSNKALIICLDEVDQLVFKDQKVLYDLLRLNQYVKNPIGMIFISNNPHVFAKLEPRILSSLSLDEIEFKSYNLEEMKDILKERADYGLRSVETGVIALASAHAINKNSDVRVGLEVLMKAARIAEQENSDKVKVDHVKKIVRDVKATKPQILKGKISDIENLILDLVNNNSKMTFDELYNKYSESLESPLTKRMFREYVNHLDEIKLLKIGTRKLGKSRFILKV